MAEARRGSAGARRTSPARRRKAAARSERPDARAERSGPAANPCIEITPSLAEYEQLCRDLTKLRKLGAPSNTAAVLAAVHAAAGAKMRQGKRKKAGRR